MTSESAIPESVPRRRNILIEENLTPMQQLIIYLAFTGMLFLRSVSFYYQEADYADPDHPQHKHYNDAVISKRVNLAAAILVFMWYVYNTFFVEPFYHKYVTRRSQLHNSSPRQQEEKTPETSDKLHYDKLSQKSEAFNTMDIRNPQIHFDTIVDEQTVLFTSDQPKFDRDLRKSNRPRPPKLPLPKKMTLGEYCEWRHRETAFNEFKVVEQKSE